MVEFECGAACRPAVTAATVGRPATCPTVKSPPWITTLQHKHLQFGHGFRVVLGNRRAQAAQMTLAPGATEGGPDNRHRGADQWLYVVSGIGEATVGGRRVELRVGTLLLI